MSKLKYEKYVATNILEEVTREGVKHGGVHGKTSMWVVGDKDWDGAPYTVGMRYHKGAWEGHTVPHLHFQVWKNNQIQNPNQYFNIPRYTNVSAEEKRRGPWFSEQAKQDAAAFNMKEHNNKRKIAFRIKVNNLLKCADQFYKLTK